MARVRWVRPRCSAGVTPSPNLAWHAQPLPGLSPAHPEVPKGKGPSARGVQSAPLQWVWALHLLLGLQAGSFLSLPGAADYPCLLACTGQTPSRPPEAPLPPGRAAQSDLCVCMCACTCIPMRVSKCDYMIMSVLVCLSVNACVCECAALLFHIISLKTCFVVKVDGGPGLGLDLGNMRLEGQGTHSLSFSQTMEHSQNGTQGDTCAELRVGVGVGVKQR